MKNIYIVLAHTGTILSRIIRFKTGEEYTHSSIALDKDLIDIYSFGRLNPYNAFIGGFVKEGIHTGTFKRFRNTRVSVYSLEVTNEQYNKVKLVIDDINNHKTDYKFNSFGLALAAMNKTTKRKNKFYCAEFVRYVLEKSDIDISKIKVKAIKPETFKKLSNMQLIYKGFLRDYNNI